MASRVYQWALWAVLTAAALLSLFLVTSDNVAPFTTQAQLHLPTSRIAAQVSAPIAQLAVHNGQQVKAGQVLMQLDPSRFQLAVTQAQAALVEAQQAQQAKQQQLAAAQATLSQRQQEAVNSARQFKRNQQLFAKNLLSQSQLDDSEADNGVRQQAVQAAQADVARLQAELRQSSEQGALAAAQAQVQLAQLDLQHTTVVAPFDGVISNLNLSQGTFISAGAPVLFLVDRQHGWVNADFNEKGSRELTVGAQVRLVFDALPGQVFIGTVSGRELAVHDASSDTNDLASVVNDDRWIRDQQKVRVQVQLPNLNPELFSGSKASVMVVSDSPVWGPLASAWMTLLAQLRYLV
ncbi:HlyD family secretion protein [Ferrimonas senticii]|uniref:HlyD family secretion protein n=1 Tax=Ferrimonas senticii TaxID=394566 RepID=UPI0004267B6E|nr:efflux RND transporter periplasmic adaptor subunit [Ferrimonas senticii]